MTDLESRSDVHDLVVDFYREIVFDDLLAPVFEQIAEVDWAAHIPRLIDYWCRVLLGEPSDTGAILGPHQHVHDLEPFRGELFDRWNRLWTEAIDRRWAGPNAERARTHAARISGVLSRRLTGTSWEPPAVDAPHETVGVTDLGALPTSNGDGVVWSLPHGGDLDANVVRLGPGAAIGEHRNDEVDVVLYVQFGSGELVGDGRVQPLSSENLALIPRGTRRSIRAGDRGITYLSLHRRRDGLTIGPPRSTEVESAAGDIIHRG